MTMLNMQSMPPIQLTDNKLNIVINSMINYDLSLNIIYTLKGPVMKKLLIGVAIAAAVASGNVLAQEVAGGSNAGNEAAGGVTANVVFVAAASLVALGAVAANSSGSSPDRPIIVDPIDPVDPTPTCNGSDQLVDGVCIGTTITSTVTGTGTGTSTGTVTVTVPVTFTYAPTL